MMVMVSNNLSATARELASKYCGKIGWLMGPSSWKRPQSSIPYTLDNDAFAVWRDRKEWDEGMWLDMLEKAAKQPFSPLWCLVPDVVANREKTLENWSKYRRVVGDYGWPTAFAVQDGMTVEDVPRDADVIFIGGTTSWKWRTVPMWCDNFSRVHVGRCPKGKVLACEKLGAESVDSTGWFRDTQNGYRIQWLKWWLEGHIKPHPEFDFTSIVVPPYPR